MKHFILFGCGKIGRKAAEIIGYDQVSFFVDNNIDLCGTFLNGKKIINVEELIKIQNNYILVVCVSGLYLSQIATQLISADIFDFVLFDELHEFMQSGKSDVEYLRGKHLVQYGKLLKINRLEKELIAVYEKEHRKVNYLLDHFDANDMKPATGYLRKCQRIIMDFMEETFSILKEIHINPFLIGENLIGWIRHKGFVPWDDKLGFGIMREDVNRLIDYAENNWVVLKYLGDDRNQQEWIDRETQVYFDQYILFIYSTHIQISRGRSCMDRLAIDIYIYDYYNEALSFQEHNKYVKEVNRKLIKCLNESERIDLVTCAIDEENVIVKKSACIYFGLDSRETYLQMDNNDWIDYSMVFPLREVLYEGKNVTIPNQPELFVSYECQNYKALPDDFEQNTHTDWKDYKRHNLTTVEFYLIDAFEIAHFMPFYDFLRGKGIYAIYIAEPPEINTTGNWFDYKKAIGILNQLEVEYETSCNPNADFAFTTQRVECLRKYKNKKINITYGCGLIKGQFAFMRESMEGFDYKFVHGGFTKELCKRNMSMQEWKKYKDTIFEMGYPRFMSSTKKYDVNEIKKELGVHTGKKIIGFFPTWGEQSCTEQFYNSLASLHDQYFIITKPHHCTSRLESEKDNLQMIRNISQIVLPSEYDICKVLEVCDLVICNAESGVSLECPWLKKDIKIIYITGKKCMDVFFPEIKNVAKIVKSPDELEQVVSDTLSMDPFVERRRAFVDQVFGEKNREYLLEIYEQIFKRKEQL